MKPQLTKKLFAFILSTMMFFIMPVLVNAQKKCPDGNCPKGQICVNGTCVKSGGGNGGGGTLCNCFVRPIPFECGQICGWRTTLTNIYYYGSQSAAISFSMEQAEKISAKIFDMTGRLVKTLADKIFEKGEHQLQWDPAGVNAGVYIIQFNTSSYSERKKISVIK